MTAFPFAHAAVALVAVLSASAACASGVSLAEVPPLSCTAPGDSRWRMGTGQSVRDVSVYMDQSAQPLDGWSTYGWRRLRAAMEAWNALRLPVRLVRARSAREAGVVVNVIQAAPRGDADRDGDQAGITYLAIAGGAIIRANVFVAVASPDGERIPVAAQQANLLHELGHALGLPHAPVNSAIMSARRAGLTLTGADIALARNHYGACRVR